jgi:hypothetical protein
LFVNDPMQHVIKLLPVTNNNYRAAHLNNPDLHVTIAHRLDLDNPALCEILRGQILKNIKRVLFSGLSNK